MPHPQLRQRGRALRRVSLALALLTFASLLPPLGRTRTGAASAQTAAHNIRVVNLRTKDLAVDRATQTIYASVPSTAGARGNSVTPVNAAAGTIGNSVFVGSEPGRLAMAGDGRTLYVSLDGAAAVRRYDISTQTPGLQFSLGEDVFTGPFFVKDMSVAPGDPDLVAVSRKQLSSSPDFEGVALYDGGVRRPLTTPRHTGSDFIEFSASASTVYGLGQDGGPRLQKMTVGASGVAVAKTTQIDTSGGDFKFDGGLMYLPSGRVYDGETAALVGTFSVPQDFFSFPNLVAPDSSVGRVYFLTGPDAFGPRTITLRAFDRQTFLPAGTLDIPGVLGNPSSLVRWGANGLAFRTTGDQIFLIQTTLIPSTTPVPPQVPTPTPPAPPPPTPTPTPLPGELREVAVVARDIVKDPATETLFASVPSSVGSGGNSIRTVNPSSAAVGPAVFVGSEPGKMAISDNGQFIYVGLDGAQAVRRFDVATRTPGPQFSLVGGQPGEQLSARDIEVAPGQPQTVAVVAAAPGSSSATAVYDGGVARPITTHVFNDVDLIEFSASPQLLYGHDTSNGDFTKMAVASCGISVMAEKAVLLQAISSDFVVENGLAYGSSGRVIDPETGALTGTYPVFAGIVDTGSGFGSNALLVDSEAGRVYFLLRERDLPFDDGPKTMLLRVFDQRTFLHVGTLAVPNILGAPTTVVRYGAHGLAFRTARNKLYLLQNALVRDGGETPAPAPVPTPPSHTLRGQVASTNTLPVPTVTLTLSGTGVLARTATDAGGNFAFTGLPFCTDFTVTPSPADAFTFEPASRTVTAADQNNPNRATAFFSAIPKMIGLAPPNQNASEGAGSAAVRILRTGDTSAAATVFYQTTNGTASDRSDYTAALGTLRFAPGETFRDVSVFITDDALAEGPETFTVSLSNPTGGLIDDFSSTASLTIADNDAASGPSPVADPAFNAEFFVRQHYRDFFNREADAAGLAFWANQITECETRPAAERQGCREVRRINVSAAFFLSGEFQETGYLVYRLHKAAFNSGERLQFRKFLPDTQQVGRGVVFGQPGADALLEQNTRAFLADFVKRPEFVALYPSAMSSAAFVDALNANTGGSLSQAERDALVGSLASGATTRAQALRAVAEDADFRAREKNAAFVLMQYFGYFRRNPPDPPEPSLNFAGYNFWLQKLNDFGGNFVAAEMVKAFIISEEYRVRFGL